MGDFPGQTYVGASGGLYETYLRCAVAHALVLIVGMHMSMCLSDVINTRNENALT